VQKLCLFVRKKKKGKKKSRRSHLTTPSFLKHIGKEKGRDKTQKGEGGRGRAVVGPSYSLLLLLSCPKSFFFFILGKRV